MTPFSTASAVDLYRRELKHIDGFLNRRQVIVWGFLLERQLAAGTRGDLFEIGVYEARSAGLLAAALRPDETLHVVDPYRTPAFESVIARTAPAARTSFHACGSEDPSVQTEIDRLAGTIRFLHIDGRHNAAFVRRELGLANRALTPDGLVCVDDFFADRYPEVTLGVFDYLRDHSNELALLLCGFNKCYLCRPDHHAASMENLGTSLLPALRAHDFPDFTLFRSNDPEGFDCYSLGKRYRDSDTYGPDGSQ